MAKRLPPEIRAWQVLHPGWTIRPRVLPSGIRRYYLRARPPGGGRVNRALAEDVASTIRLANEIHDAVLAEDEACLEACLEARVAQRVTLAEFLPRAVELLTGQNRAEKTVIATRTAVHKIAPFLPQMMDTVTVRDAAQVVAHLAGREGLSPETIRGYVSRLAGVWRLAEAEGHVREDANPWERRRKLGIPAPRAKGPPRTFTPAQIETFLRCAPTPEARDILLTYYETGLRRSELFDLRWYDVALDRPDTDHGVVVVRPETSKGGYSGRVVVLTARVADVLRRWRQSRPTPAADGADFVFLRDDRRSPPAGRFSAERMSIIVRQTRERAGKIDPALGGLRVKDLRSSFATHLFDRSGNLAVTQDALGHRSPSTTNRYLGVKDIRHRVAAMREAFVGDGRGGAHRAASGD